MLPVAEQAIASLSTDLTIAKDITMQQERLETAHVS